MSRGKGCCAALCTSRQYLPDGTRSGVRFFKIPGEVVDNSKMAQVWCNLIKRKHGKDKFNFSKSTNICSEHFTTSDIVIRSNGMWRLKPGVKPSLFPWTKPKMIRGDPSNRMQSNVDQWDDLSTSFISAEFQVYFYISLIIEEVVYKLINVCGEPLYW